MATTQTKPLLAADAYAGRVVLITGGGTGLGLAKAKRYCALGAQVCIAARRESVLKKACEEVEREVPGAKIFSVAVDVRDGVSVSRAFDAIVSRTGAPPSVVINNAAGNFIAPSETLSTNAFRTIVDIVLIGTANVTLEAVRRWLKQRAKAEAGTGQTTADVPQLVVMSVGASYVTSGCAFVAPSAAAKGGVWNLMQSFASEFGKHNMRFFMVSPGPIFTEGAFARLDPTGMFMEAAKDKETLGQVVPLRRFGTPDEYASFVAFLTSDHCAWLSGSNIHFDGASHTAGGEFQMLHQVTADQWKMAADMIRKTNKKHKAGAAAKL